MCKLEKAQLPYRFEVNEGHFSNKSSYGSLEVEFSSKLVTIVRWIKGWFLEQPTADAMFLAKLYYHQEKQSKATAHIVMVPLTDMWTVGAVCMPFM